MTCESAKAKGAGVGLGSSKSGPDGGTVQIKIMRHVFISSEKLAKMADFCDAAHQACCEQLSG